MNNSDISLKYNIRSIEFLQALYNKVVFVRVDFNVPVDERFNIMDISKITSAKRTINHIVSNGGNVVLVSHFGRPDIDNGDMGDYSFTHIVDQISEILGHSIVIISPFGGRFLSHEDIDTSFADTERENMFSERSVVMLENIRLFKGELGNEEALVRSMASIADFYVNDAFSVSHREHASVYGLPIALGENAYAGVAMMDELSALEGVITEDLANSTMIISGKKVNTKLHLLRELVHKAKRIMISGGIGNTFLKVRGIDIGKSFYDESAVSEIMDILWHPKIVLPIDYIVSDKGDIFVVSGSAERNGNAEGAMEHEIGDGVISDIGPGTVKLFKEEICNSERLILCGPLGIYEDPRFNKGMRDLIEEIGSADIIKVAGGGDTIAAVNMIKSEDKFDYCSTAGGAFLEWLCDRELPGIKSIQITNQ